MTISTNKIILNSERNVIFTTMLQDVGGEFEKLVKRPAILILPGGGYAMCSDREAEVVAYPFLQAGYHAFVLRYSVGEHRTWPNPLDDYEQAMDLIRSKEEWHVLADRIAVAGFSAGGHLAACAATIAKNKPNAAILCYAALEQEIASYCQPGTNIPAPIDHVDENTVPCFLVAARDDRVVPIHNTLNFEIELEKQGIQFESHIYSHGGHGFGSGVKSIAGTDVCSRVPKWTDDAVGWLEDVFGELTWAGMGEPTVAHKLRGDLDHFLSVDCTYAHIRLTPDATPILKDFYAVVEQVIQERFQGRAGARAILDGMTLRDMMRSLAIPAEQIAQINDALQKIPNSY